MSLNTPNTQTSTTAVSTVPAFANTAKVVYRKFEDGFDSTLSKFMYEKPRDICNSYLQTAEDETIEFLNNQWKRLKSLIDTSMPNLTSGDFLTTVSDISNSAVNFICTSVNSSIKLVTETLDVLIGSIGFIIAKLIKMIDKINAALIKLIRTIEDCIFPVIYGVIDKLVNLIPTAFDIPNIANLIDSCPQLKCFILDKFSKYIDDPIPTSTEDILYKVRNKIRTGMTNFVNDLFIDIIKSAINEFISNIIKTVDSLKRTIRESISGYLKLIFKKRDIPKQIRWMFTKNDCNPIRKANLFEWVDMMKRLSLCIDAVCTTIKPELIDQIEKYNRELRLGFNFWKGRGVAYDMFMSLNKDSSVSIREEHIKKKTLESNINDIKIVSNDLLQKNKSSVNIDTYIDLSSNKNNLITSGILTPNGDIQFRNGIEPKLVRLYNNIKTDALYLQPQYDLLSVWDSKYKKDDLINVKKQIEKYYSDINSIDSTSINQVPTIGSNKTNYIPYKVTNNNSTQKTAYKPLKDALPSVFTEDRYTLYTNWYNEVR